MNSEVHLLLRARDTAFKSGDTLAYSTARSNLKKVIRIAKRNYTQQIQDPFLHNNDPRRLWQGIQAITDYKSLNNSPAVSDATLPDEMNNFYARFDRDNMETAIKALLPPDDQVLTLSTFKTIFEFQQMASSLN
ncbi:hypothetical protein AAFF_G00110450 [Aldrovandia affinis]|uniref:Uncharacterized protein n=1 Tax=Aldrovandia affinis TaxID=143900 RepID=A0AAD7RW85_9TELE|nr:hypothetical protein AAFF_G00110450 [Aldrovandia affinis]